MSQDIPDASNPQVGFWSGVADTSGLVVDGWVEGQFADDLAGGGVDDATCVCSSEAASSTTTLLSCLPTGWKASSCRARS
jgi:hypothetical protein